MTFADWWAAYDPDDANTRADRNMAERAWDAAVEAERERCAAFVAAFEPEGIYRSDDENGSYWESDAELTLKRCADAIRGSAPPHAEEGT